MHVSSISLLEIEYGIERTADPAKRDRLTRWFESVMTLGAVAVIPVDAPVARAAGRMKWASDRQGRPRSFEDLLIAATAVVHGAVVVTRNIQDFEGLGLPVLNPFR